MLSKKCFLVGIFTVLSVSLAISAQPVHPTTGEPLVIDCLRGTPDAIDGDLSDWNLEAMTPAALDAVEQLYFGQENWTGPEDCSGEFYLLWDDVNIYMAVVVKDEKLSMNKSGGDIWNADCIEVLFATTDARADHSWSNPTIHYQYGFNANNQKWNWCNMDGPGQSEPDYLQVASSVTADGYILEASIEYGQMLSLDFSEGNTIGLHSVLDDTDNGDAELQMTWTGLAAHDQSQGFGHMVLSAEPVPGPGPVDPGTDGLVAHYAFENDTTDSSGNGLDGVIIGDAVFVEGVEGMALDFNGDDYVDCGTNDVLNNLSDAMTVSAWVNIRSVTTTWMGIVMKGETAWRLGVNGDTTGVHYAFTGGARGWQASNSVTELPFGEWHHIAGTYDKSVGATVWVDGIAETVNPDLDGIATNEISLLLGENPEATGRLYDGILDEVRIYNRAVSEGEMLYLAGERVPPVDPGSAGLLARWACDEGEGAVVGDVSGNGRDGVFVNGDPSWVEGVSGSAAELIGPTLIEIPPLDLELTEATMAGWIKPNGPQPDWSSIIMTRNPGLATGFNILGYQLAYHWNDTSSSWNFRGGDMIAEDDWTFAAVTIEPDKATFYVNGEAGSVNEIEHAPCLWNSNIYLGGDGNDNWIARRMNGALDDVLMYDRALSGAEIRYLAGFRENLLQNPGFEEDEAILDDPDWFQWCTWNPAEGAGSNTTIVDTDAVDGAKSLLVEPVGPENWHFILVNISFPADLNKNYTASFWAKADEPRPLTVQMKASDNSVNAWGATSFDLTTEWAEYSYTSEVLHVDVKLEFLCAGSEVPFLLDAVSVTEE